MIARLPSNLNDARACITAHPPGGDVVLVVDPGVPVGTFGGSPSPHLHLESGGRGTPEEALGESLQAHIWGDRVLLCL